MYTRKKPSPESISDFIRSVDLPSLSENRKDVCGGEVSVQECERAINNIKSIESPGEDGLAIEFYRSGIKICKNNTLTIGQVYDEKHLITIVQEIFYSSNYRS